MGKFINRILRAGEGRTLKKLEAIRKLVKGLAVGKPLFEFVGLASELFVRHLLEGGL